MNKTQNEFLGCTSAVCICNEFELKVLKEFLGANNLFDNNGNIASQINAIRYPIVFYRDAIGYHVNQASEREVRNMNYHVVTFGAMFPPVVEQRSLFGGDDAPGIKPPEDDLIQPEPLDPIEDPMMDEPIDAETKEIKNELSLKETLNQLTIGALTPARCDGNLLDLKDTVIEIVTKKKDIAVTQDNFKETKEVVTDLNSKAKVLKEQRATFNKEVKKFTDPYSNAFSQIINAFEDTSKAINANIKVFEEEEKNTIKERILSTWIMPTIKMMMEHGAINQEIADKFNYDDSWSKQSSFTKKGELIKKVSDGINAELERISGLYTQYTKDIETIESTVKQLAAARGVDAASFKADTYIELYKKGSSMPDIQSRINTDLEMIKKVAEDTARKQAEQGQIKPSEQQSVQDVQQPENVQNTPITQENHDDMTMLSDKDTGELLAKGNDRGLSAKVIQTPEKYQGKTYKYTYSFSGSFGTIKTFSNILKLLSMMFKDFKYEKK